MSIEDFDYMTDEELELFRKQLDATLLTLRQAVRRTNEHVLKNDAYRELLMLSVDLNIEITTRKEHSNENI